MKPIMPTSPGDALSEREATLHYLRDRDVPCPLCGYNLRNLVEPRCPECGREVRLRIGLVEPAMGAWLLAILACAPAAGLGVLCAVVTIKRGFPSRREGVSFLLMYAWCLLAVPSTIALSIFRSRILRLQRSTQWLLAAGLTGATLACFITGIVRLFF